MIFKLLFLIFILNISYSYDNSALYSNIVLEDTEFFLQSFKEDNNNFIANLRNTNWKSFMEFSLKDLQNSNILFLKIELPKIKYNNPAIYIKSFTGAYEVFTDKTKIYPLNKYYNHKYFDDNIISIDNINLTDNIYLKINYNKPLSIGAFDVILFGEKESLVEKSISDKTEELQLNFKDFILSIIFNFIGISSFFVFLFVKKNLKKIFFSFSLFSICLGIKYYSTPFLLSFFDISPKYFLYLEYFSFLLVPVGLFAFIEYIFQGDKFNIIRRLWQFHILLTFVMIKFIEKMYINNLFYLILIILIANCFICFFSILKNAHKKNIKIKNFFLIFLSFFILLLIIELFHVTGFINFQYDFFGFGTLIFCFGLIYVLIDNYMLEKMKLQESAFLIEKNKNEILQLQKINIQSKFDALKNQINPHFLFNTFNTLASIVEENKSIAIEFIQSLSKTYRYILQTKTDELTTISDELNFLESYLFILMKRHVNNLIFKTNIPEPIKAKFIPPLSLQLLIENAVKHNIISNKNPLTINIECENNYLIVKNNLQKKINTTESTGIGLKNIIERYKFFTNENVIILSENNFFIVKIPILNKVH